MDTIQERVCAFADKWRDYCLPDKKQIISPEINSFVEEIDKMLVDNSENKKQKAKLYYLKGTLLELIPGYEKQPQQLLTKSVKLNPANGDCWNVLAHVLFKKNDFQGASKAIQMAIQAKGKNKVSLRYQSVLLRVQGKLPEEKRKNIDESVKIIKQALIMDLKDWLTWYFLGNAYFSNFIANYKKIQQLENAAKAYNEAQKYLKFKYPDLNFNRANVEAHLEQYDKAVKDLIIANQLDPTLGSTALIEKIKKRMEFTKVSFERSGQIKAAKLEQIVKTIPNSLNKNSTQDSKVQIVSIKNLKQKENLNKMLSTKIICKLTRQDDIPTSYLAIDSEGNFLCISIYNVKSQTLDEKIKKDTLLTMLDPYIKKVTFEGFTYYSAQNFDFTKIWANKKGFTPEDFNPNSVFNQAFQK